MPKRSISLSIIIIVLLVGIREYTKVKYETATERFVISLNSPNLGNTISDWNQDDNSYSVRAVKKITKTDTAIVFVQVTSSREGFCKLEEGLNHKYRIKNCEYRSVGENNWFRSRKIKTNKGSYGVFEGENANGKIKSIIVSKKEFKSESDIQANNSNEFLVPQASFFFFIKKIETSTPIADFFNVAYLDQNGKSIDYFIQK
ncbi:hypothetical protein COJ46_04335 [Bacillus sp. AFS077874]|uniref:hypothetical protein n=1 Tax=unclassified Bacillus (in: firmicutes) TaxID=185979 RepID=UPI000BED4014|nr:MULTISPECIES: hypothetical protein [unclassified Bacillus (in: firmicutes)]PEC47714.1 hypothetical protein CON00_20085 [Bacillus sp. AFS096315]PFM83034.1 hypothetical protein COJ46_04335 [Bacillus sp. AFS077874]